MSGLRRLAGRWRSVSASEPSLSAGALSCGAAAPAGRRSRRAPPEPTCTTAVPSAPAAPPAPARRARAARLRRPAPAPARRVAHRGHACSMPARARAALSPSPAPPVTSRRDRAGTRGVERAARTRVPVLAVGIDGDAERDSLDAVTLWHVLEHLEDPGAALAGSRAGWRRAGAWWSACPTWPACRPGWAATLVSPRRAPPPHALHAGGLARLLDARLRGAGGPPPAARAQPVRDVAVGGQPCSPAPVLSLQPAQAKRPARRADLALTALAVPLAPVAALAELAAGLAGAAGRSRCWPAAGSSACGWVCSSGFGSCEDHGYLGFLVDVIFAAAPRRARSGFHATADAGDAAGDAGDAAGDAGDAAGPTWGTCRPSSPARVSARASSSATICCFTSAGRSAPEERRQRPHGPAGLPGAVRGLRSGRPLAPPGLEHPGEVAEHRRQQLAHRRRAARPVRHVGHRLVRLAQQRARVPRRVHPRVRPAIQVPHEAGLACP